MLGLLPQVRLEGPPRVDAQRDAVVLGPHGRPRPGAHGDEVRRQRWGGRQGGAARGGQGRGAVAEHRPLLGRGDRQRVGRLEVGLVEAGEDRRRGVEEEVPVHVVLAVRGVGAAVQALAVVAVGHRRLDVEHVVGLELGQGQPSVAQGCRVEGPPVQRRRDEVAGPDLDEGVGPRLVAREADAGAGAEDLGAAVEVEVDLHRVDGQAGGAGDGLGTGQRRHTPSQPERSITVRSQGLRRIS